MGKAETKSTPASIKLSYTPPDDPDQDPQEMVRDPGIPIRVGRDPGHTGLRLSVKNGDRSVSGWAVEITLIPEGVHLRANNIEPMHYSTVSSQDGSIGTLQTAVELPEDGWIDIPGEDGQVGHRVSWELRDFSPPTREKTDSSIGETLGHTIFKAISENTDKDGNLTYLMTCAAFVSPWFFEFEEIKGGPRPLSNHQIGRMKKVQGDHAVENLKKAINAEYRNAQKPEPGFLGTPGRDQLASWIRENHVARDGKKILTREKIRELLPGFDLLTHH